jgi:putative SOS response-associated peptidase YedK
MRFGFTLDRDNRPLVNARSETAGEKPMFRDAFRSRRCVIPASWYFEWEHKKDNTGKVSVGQKYLIQPRGSAMTWLCGLYRIENGLPELVILTREPEGDLRRIHDRMPVILPKNRILQWISPDSKPEDLLKLSLTDMVFEKAE